MNAFRYPAVILQELVTTRKIILNGDVNFKEAGRGNQEYRFTLQAEGGPPCLLWWIIHFGRNEDVTTYHAVLLVDRQRISSDAK